MPLTTYCIGGFKFGHLVRDDIRKYENEILADFFYLIPTKFFSYVIPVVTLVILN